MRRGPFRNMISGIAQAFTVPHTRPALLSKYIRSQCKEQQPHPCLQRGLSIRVPTVARRVISFAGRDTTTRTNHANSYRTSDQQYQEVPHTLAAPVENMYADDHETCMKLCLGLALDVQGRSTHWQQLFVWRS